YRYIPRMGIVRKWRRNAKGIYRKGEGPDVASMKTVMSAKRGPLVHFDRTVEDDRRTLGRIGAGAAGIGAASGGPLLIDKIRGRKVARGVHKWKRASKTPAPGSPVASTSTPSSPSPNDTFIPDAIIGMNPNQRKRFNRRK